MRDSKLGRWVVLGLALTSPLWGCGNDEDDGNDAERERIEKGLTLSPVPLNLDGKDRDLVGLGSYIVNAQAACNDCHTNPPFAPGRRPVQGRAGADQLGPLPGGRDVLRSHRLAQPHPGCLGQAGWR